MRLAFASVLALTLVSGMTVLSTSGCAYSTGQSAADRPSPQPVRAALTDLGIEGRSYVNDLGAVSSVHVKGVHNFGDDFLVEDIHGHLTYIDGASLFARWEYQGLPGPFDAKPCATSTAVVGISKGNVHVLSRDAGLDEITPRHVGLVASAAPVASDSTLYVPSYGTGVSNKTIHSVSLASGFVGWGWRTSSDIVAGMAVAGGAGNEIFYAASSDGVVYGFAAAVATTRDVEPAWTTNLHSQVTRDLIVDGGDLGIVTSNHRLVCMDRIGGNIRWEAYPNEGEKSEGVAQFGTHHVFYVCGGELRAYDRATGAHAWSVKGATQFVAERGSRTIVSCPCGTVKAIETKTGKVLAEKMLAGWSFPARSKANSTIFAVSNRGMIVSVEQGF